MKKAISILLVLLMLLALNACGGTGETIQTDLSFEEGDAVRLSTRWPVYDKSIETITYFLRNNTAADITFGLDYMLLRQSGSGWEKIAPSDDTSWPAIACCVEPGETYSDTLRVSGLKNGVYRIVKTIGGKNYYAEFEVGQSNITADTPYGYAAQQTLPKSYEPETAEKNGDLVLGSGEIKNADKFDTFLSMIKLGAPDMLRITQYTVEGKAIISDIVYNGSYFTLTTDSTRDNFSTETITTGIYSYLITDGSGIFLSNCASYSYAKSYIHGLDGNTVLLTYTVEDGWCTSVSALNELGLLHNNTTMKIWLNADSWCCLNADGVPGFSDAGRGMLLELPKAQYPDLGKAVGIEWLDEKSFVVAAENSGDPLFSYILLVYELENGSVSCSKAYSANSYEVEDGALIVGE